MPYYVYIMSNSHNSVVYVGVTGDLARRVYEHKNHLLKGFSDRYNTEKLVFAEAFANIEDAIASEKKIKGWARAKKNALIEKANPNWEELEIG